MIKKILDLIATTAALIGGVVNEHKKQKAQQDIMREQHHRAFAVAKTMKQDILDDIKLALDDALAKGLSREEFIANLAPTLQKKGWWGKKRMRDPVSGIEVDAQLGSFNRLKTIFDTNISVARGRVRSKQQWENRDSRPYWMYVTARDSRVRHTHSVLDGLVFPADDPFWQTNYPPNGFNCRCRVRALTTDQVEALGLKVGNSKGKLRTVGGVKGGYNVPGKGQFVPDEGWDFNPGKSDTGIYLG